MTYCPIGPENNCTVVELLSCDLPFRLTACWPSLTLTARCWPRMRGRPWRPGWRPWPWSRSSSSSSSVRRRTGWWSWSQVSAATRAPPASSWNRSTPAPRYSTVLQIVLESWACDTCLQWSDNILKFLSNAKRRNKSESKWSFLSQIFSDIATENNCEIL